MSTQAVWFRISILTCAVLVTGCAVDAAAPYSESDPEADSIESAGIRDIEFNTSGRLTVIQSDEKSGVEIDGDGVLPASLILERDGDTLFIDALEPVSRETRLTPSLNLKVYVSELQSLKVRHRGQVQVDGIRTKALSLRIVGDGKVSVNDAEIGRLGINIGGQGRVKLRNVGGDKIQGNVHGQGQINAEQLDVDRLSLRIAGHGAVVVSGNVRSQSVRIEGHGALSAEDLATAESSLSIEGHGAAVVWTRGPLNLDVGHHGSVQYRGAQLVRSSGDPSHVRELVGGVY